MASNLRIVPQNQSVEAQTVTLAYGIVKNLSVVLATGMVEKHSDLMTFYADSNLIPRGMSFPGTDSLHDSSAAVIWRAYEDPINRVKVNLGMSFPTGSGHNLGGALLQPDGEYTIGPAFYGMQSGTGTYDVLPGIMYPGTIAPWSWGLSYRARLPLTYNPQAYMWGNYLEVNAWGGYTWFPGFTTTIRANFNVQSPIAGADWLMPGKLQSANPNFYGGKRIELYAGADIDGKLFGVPGFSIGVEGGGRPSIRTSTGLNSPRIGKRSSLCVGKSANRGRIWRPRHRRCSRVRRSPPCYRLWLGVASTLALTPATFGLAIPTPASATRALAGLFPCGDRALYLRRRAILQRELPGSLQQTNCPRGLELPSQLGRADADRRKLLSSRWPMRDKASNPTPANRLIDNPPEQERQLVVDLAPGPDLERNVLSRKIETPKKESLARFR